MSFMGQVGLLTAQLHGDGEIPHPAVQKSVLSDRRPIATLDCAGMAGIHADSNGAYSIVKAGGSVCDHSPSHSIAQSDSHVSVLV